MEKNETRVTESNTAVNGITISEPPGKPFSITVEIPLFCIMLALSLSGAAISNIILYRTCMYSLYHSEDECRIFLSPEKSNVTKDLELEVQKYANIVSTTRSVIEAIVPAILSLFIGVWSDTHGRKPLIVWPLFGMSFSGMMMVVFVMLDSLGPWWYLLTVVPISLTGGPIVFFTGAFCYLTDITSQKSRSFRMLLLEASVSAGILMGAMPSAYIIKAIGNLYLFIIVAAIYVFAYAYSNIFLTESLTGAIKGGLCSVLDFLLVREMVRECFKVRQNNGRAQILLLAVINCLSVFLIYGLLNVDYYYVRDKVHWSLKEYNMYSAMTTLISFFGSFLGIGLVQKLFNISDLNFTMVAFISTGAEYLIRASATTTWHMYIGALVALFKGVSSPLIRSFLTKILPVEDIAKVFALMCTIEGICPLLAPVLYTALYNFTASTFLPAIYILSAALVFTCAGLLGFVQYFRRASLSYQRLYSGENSCY